MKGPNAAADRKLADVISVLKRASAHEIRDQVVYEIGRAVQSRVRSCFRLKQDPDGKPWPPAKDGHRRLLHDSGELEASIQMTIGGRDTVRLHTDDPVALFHARGTKWMPPRRFFPLPGQLPAAWRKQLEWFARRKVRSVLKMRGG